MVGSSIVMFMGSSYSITAPEKYNNKK